MFFCLRLNTLTSKISNLLLPFGAEGSKGHEFWYIIIKYQKNKYNQGEILYALFLISLLGKQVIFSFGLQKKVPGGVKQGVMLHRNSCIGMGMGRLNICCLRWVVICRLTEVVLWADLDCIPQYYNIVTTTYSFKYPALTNCHCTITFKSYDKVKKQINWLPWTMLSPTRADFQEKWLFQFRNFIKVLRNCHTFFGLDFLVKPLILSRWDFYLNTHSGW